MKIITKQTESYFRIYREKWGVLLFGLVIGLLSLLVGAVTLYLSNDDLFVETFGYVFSVAGGLVLLAIPGYYKRLIEDGGDLLLEANASDLLVSPEIKSKPHKYGWESVLKIVLTVKGVSKSLDDWGIGKELASVTSGNKTYNSNLIIIYLAHSAPDIKPGMISNLLNNIQRTPNGAYYTYSQFPRNEIDLTASSLRKFCPSSVIVEQYSKVSFDYGKGAERYQP